MATRNFRPNGGHGRTWSDQTGVFDGIFGATFVGAAFVGAFASAVGTSAESAVPSIVFLGRAPKMLQCRRHACQVRTTVM